MEQPITHDTPIADRYTKAYAPYRREVKFCLIIDIVIALLITLLLLTTGLLLLLPVIPLFFAVEYALNYRRAHRARQERDRSLFVQQQLEITAVREAHSTTTSLLREIYPGELQVRRCRLYCRTADGQRLVLHGIMSVNKRQLLRDGIDRGQLSRCTVTYGAMTHILLSFDDREKLCDELSHSF